MQLRRLSPKQKFWLASTAAGALVTVATLAIAYWNAKVAERAAIAAEQTRLDGRRAQLKLDIAATFDEWKLSAQIMRCYVEALKLSVDTTGHNPTDIEQGRRDFYERVGDISKYTEEELRPLEQHIAGYRAEINTTMKQTLSRIRAEAKAEQIERLDKVCHHGASSR